MAAANAQPAAPVQRRAHLCSGRACNILRTGQHSGSGVAPHAVLRRLWRPRRGGLTPTPAGSGDRGPGGNSAIGMRGGHESVDPEEAGSGDAPTTSAPPDA
jgi:hypothetical protein